MNIKASYNKWSSQYDTNLNKTRDLEGNILKGFLKTYTAKSILEIGCGTGKNTAWFLENFEEVTSVDFSEEMLTIAKNKIQAAHVTFIEADINLPWAFLKSQYDLVSFSLVLEHIEDLENIFNKTSNALKDGGYVYIGELHPFKQYSGSKARFETESGTETLTCFTHHISEFIHAAEKHGLQLIKIEEHFDEDDKNGLPRILTLMFQKIKS